MAGKTQTFKRLVKRMEDTAMRYFIYSHELELMMSNRKMYSFLKQNRYEKELRLVQETLSIINPLEMTLISDEFFRDEIRCWSRMYPTASTYYRCKKKAMKHFLRTYNALK